MKLIRTIDRVPSKYVQGKPLTLGCVCICIIYSIKKDLTILVRSLSGRPGSNRRHSAWKADALPTELLPQL